MKPQGTRHYLSPGVGYYTMLMYFFFVNMYLKRLQEKFKRMENWKQLSIKFKTHKYNTGLISGKMFDSEMLENGFFFSPFLNLIVLFLNKV